MTIRDQVQKIAEKKLPPQEMLKELSEIPFSNFLLIGRTGDGTWTSFLANLTLEDASYAAIHANMVVQNQHALQIHKPEKGKGHAGS